MDAENPRYFLRLDAKGQARDRAQTSLCGFPHVIGAAPHGARPVNQSFIRRASLWLSLGVSLNAAACGYSQEEWDQKVRENEALRSQLAAQKQAHDKCE